MALVKETAESPEKEQSQDVFKEAMEKLLEIATSVVDNSKLKKRDIVPKSFRKYCIAYKTNDLDEFFESFKNVRKSIGMQWGYGTTLHDLLIKNDFKFTWESENEYASEPVVHISKIYQLAQEYKDPAKTHLSDEKKAYPDMLLLQFAKMMHYIEGDERLHETITHLENTIKISEQSINGIPPAIAQMAQRFARGQGNGFIDKLRKVGGKLVESGVMEKAMAGDMDGAMKSITAPDLKDEISGTLGPMLNPLLQKTAKMFKEKGVLPEVLENNEDVTIENVFNKITNAGSNNENLEKMKALNPAEIISDFMNGEGGFDTALENLGAKLSNIMPKKGDEAGSAGPAPPTAPEGYTLSDDYDLYDDRFLKRYVAKFGPEAGDPRFVSSETGKKDYPIKNNIK